MDLGGISCLVSAVECVCPSGNIVWTPLNWRARRASKRWWPSIRVNLSSLRLGGVACTMRPWLGCSEAVVGEDVTAWPSSCIVGICVMFFSWVVKSVPMLYSCGNVGTSGCWDGAFIRALYHANQIPLPLFLGLLRTCGCGRLFLLSSPESVVGEDKTEWTSSCVLGLRAISVSWVA